MSDWTSKDENEIIALRIKDNLYFGELAVKEALKYNEVHEIYSRAVFRLMGELDLSPKWGELAEHAPTLFLRS